MQLRIFTERELVRKEEALYLRFFTQELKMRKFAICNGPGRWARSKLIFLNFSPLRCWIICA